MISRRRLSITNNSSLSDIEALECVITMLRESHKSGVVIEQTDYKTKQQRYVFVVTLQADNDEIEYYVSDLPDIQLDNN